MHTYPDIDSEDSEDESIIVKEYVRLTPRCEYEHRFLQGDGEKPCTVPLNVMCPNTHDHRLIRMMNARIESV